MTVGTVDAANPVAAAGGGITSVVGQTVVGKFITSPWLPGHQWEIGQGYGQTANTYPLDHGTTHWHSGVDIDCPPHTVLVLPAGLQGKAVYLDNPDGYGTALIIQIGGLTDVGRGQRQVVRSNDIYLGHLASRIVANGQQVRAGDHLAYSDNTGRSTGPHLHLEVRPPDGKYGTDVDPSSYLLAGAPEGIIPSFDPFAGIGDAIGQAEQDFARTLIGLGQTALGGTMMLAGGATMAFGLRGMSGRQAIRASQGTARQLNRRRIERRPQPAAVPVNPVERSRLRPTLQREVARQAPPSPQTGGSLSSLPRARMTAGEYEASLGGISLQRQRELATQGIRVRTGSQARPKIAA